MNTKAEKIDRAIQFVNRNLLLISYGQIDNTTPLDLKSDQKVEASAFEHDKYALDMVQYVQRHKKFQNKPENSNDLINLWKKYFTEGLEALLIECAVVEDEIERICFVSRVYRWFTEKLSEFRNLSNKNIDDKAIYADDYKSSTNEFGFMNTKMSKLLGSYGVKQPSSGQIIDVEGLEEQVDFSYNRRHDISSTGLSDRRAMNTKSAPSGDLPIVPTVFHRDIMSASGRDNKGSYGLLYNKPESEGERKMHELWLARRKQEAFDWKSQQQIDLVMNRLALQRSRFESNALRRQEMNSFMSQRQHHSDDSQQHHMISENDDDMKNVRYAPINQHHHHSAGRSQQIANLQAIYANLKPRDIDLKSGLKKTRSIADRDFQEHQPSSSSKDNDVDGSLSLKGSSWVSLEGGDSVISTTSAFDNSIAGENKEGKASKRAEKQKTAPMRFGNKLPDGFEHRGYHSIGNGSKTPATMSVSSSKKSIIDDVPSTEHHLTDMERNQYYMQLSDSDDDDKPDIPSMMHLIQNPIQGKIRPNKVPIITFKHDKPAMRERPKSARLFHTIAYDDPELKVHYRHSNYRRMPLSDKIEEWLDDREEDRTQKSRDYSKKLVDSYTMKSMKKSSSSSKNTNSKGTNDITTNRRSSALPTTNKQHHTKKYQNASEFMALHFPNFDDVDDVNHDDSNENDQHHPSNHQGPMRTTQLIECARVMAAFEEKQIAIDEDIVRKALLIPQDRPEAVCLEGLRDPLNVEGLMVNPVAKEYWRKFRMTETGKKKKGRRRG